MAAKKTPKATPGVRATRPVASPRPSLPGLRYEFLVAALVMALAICVLYPELVFQDKIFFAGDNQAAESFSSVGRKALENGVYPVWNPY
ncbi:MAG: hypothetical protein O7D32_02170, partial [bacterium]|nr:hypothetical protein [bacterium]